MWKEITHERPARRGWTVATLSLAFIGTVALAKIMVDHRANDSSVVSGEQSPPDWPITFTLPRDHRWRVRQDRADEAGTVDSDAETVAFDGRSASGGHGILLIILETMPAKTPLKELAEAVAGENLGESREIAMGPLDGRMIVETSGPGGARVLAFGRSAEGLAIVVAYLTSRRTGDEVEVVQAVCESIAFTD